MTHAPFSLATWTMFSLEEVRSKSSAVLPPMRPFSWMWIWLAASTVLVLSISALVRSFQRRKPETYF